MPTGWVALLGTLALLERLFSAYVDVRARCWWCGEWASGPWFPVLLWMWRHNCDDDADEDEA